MPPTSKLFVHQLKRDELLAIVDTFDVDVPNRKQKDAIAASLTEAEVVDWSEALAGLSRDRLKEICEALGLDAGGREKALLVERILGPRGELALSSPASTRKPASGGGNGGRRGRGTKKATGELFDDYRHEATRKNNPPAGLVEFDRPPAVKRQKYAYDPHLDPQLQWAGKAERTSFEVETVSLHIHERVSTQAILKVAKREDAQRELFADLDLPESKQIDFYQHDVNWANRLVLGDSLLVMNSLLERERMAGQVQCIYVDPPYGVAFNSNFQPTIGKRDVKDGDDASLTREPEQIQAYRDTWELGIHSYLTYLRDRLLLARELLNETGSVFVQISDDNVHHVRELMDEVFGAENFVVLIAYKRLGTMVGEILQSSAHYLCWYAKERQQLKAHKLFEEQLPGIGAGDHYTRVEATSGTTRPLARSERGVSLRGTGLRAYQLISLATGGYRPNTTVDYEFQGKIYHPGANKCWRTTPDGLDRLAKAGRIEVAGKTIRYKQYLDDFPYAEASSIWQIAARDPDNVYVVQTPSNIIARAILMTTDPGDLVLDPTCGSGTTAYVAEQWGRRWITCDTSRVALHLARQRILTARFPFYRLRSRSVRDGFVYQTVPHVTLKSIAQNPRLDERETREEMERVIRESAPQETLYDRPEEDAKRVRVAGPFTVEAIPVAHLDEEDGAGVSAETPHTPAEALANDWASYMIDLVKRSGVHFGAGRTLDMASLRPVKGDYEWLHAEADATNGHVRRVAVSLGPKHAPVTPRQVLDAIRETRGYDIVLFVGFACDPEARKVIDKGVHGRELHFVHAAPDILVTDDQGGRGLLKTSRATRLFTVFGAPDVRLHEEPEGQISVELVGIDLYDPITGETAHARGDGAKAFFVDHDYDGRTFCVSQALFPSTRKNPWEKLQKALKGTIDEDKFAQLQTTRSLPFEPGKRVAVTVVDDRGNEVVKVIERGR